MGHTLPEDAPIRSLEELVAPFFAAHKPESAFRVGTEAEKFGVYIAGGKAVPYEGDRGVRRVLELLAERHGWTPAPEYEGGALIALRRGDASITLEPGAQLELSGAPLTTIHETRAELDNHAAELEDVSRGLGIAWLGLGFHPLARQEDLPWVPKLRYGIMREYLPTRGSMGLDMMRRTSTVQANLDYGSEADAMRKLRVALRLQPVVTAMFANSPWVEGHATGERSHRALVWMNMDPDRSGLLPFAWESAPTYQRYIAWALDVPMFLVKRGSKVLHNTGQTFRAFLRDGFEGASATHGDWKVHLATLFPEVRLKNTLEMRGADSQGRELSAALPALWKGLLYDRRALERAEVLSEGLSLREVEAARPEIVRSALRARLQGRPLADWAGDVFEIARDGLQRIGHRDAAGRDESIHLAALGALIEAGQSPADALLAFVREEHLVDGLLARARI